tara:strand:- start:613 stop:1002 length:390 start_codon:yes stop_codon:yes gene_type:complete
MEDDFYATIKFKNGEEIFAKVVYEEDDDRIILLLDNPITIDKIKNRGGVHGYKVEPWLRTTTEDLFVVNLEDVLTMSETKDKQTIVMYETFVQQNHSLDSNEIKLNRKMGYISTINEAKKSLEKIYKIK